jgi:polygalacturonase
MAEILKAPGLNAASNRVILSRLALAASNAEDRSMTAAIMVRSILLAFVALICTAGAGHAQASACDPRAYGAADDRWTDNATAIRNAIDACTAQADEAAVTGPAAICDPRAYGAVNDGRTDNAAAIQNAIEACAARGGGIVPVDGGGTYVTGPISLRSNVFLRIGDGTTLKNTTDHARYQPAFIGYPFQFRNDPAATGGGPSLPGLPEAMISASGVENTGIIGTGTLDGSGADQAAGPTPDNPDALSWWQLAANAKSAASAPGYTYPGYPDIPTSNGLPRPWLIEFYDASNVVVSGITVTNSPMWCLGLRYVKGAVVSGYTVRNPPDSPNTDGVDLVGAENVMLVKLDIATGDDNVAIKSGLPGVPSGAYYAPPYNLPRTPTSNVVVADSAFGRGHGLSVGSETVNGIHRIWASDITFAGTDNGFRIKTGRDRGNQIDEMSIQNLTMTDVPTPLSISEYYPTIPSPSVPDIEQAITNEPFVHDIAVADVTATNPRTVRPDAVTTGGLIIGVPESPIYNLTLDRIHISAAQPTYMRLRNLVDSSCSDVTITPLKEGAPNDGSTFDDEGGLRNAPGCAAGSGQ